jgi:hypothetical protein
MAKNVCILLNNYGEQMANAAADAFRFGAVSAEMGNRTVVYLGANWHGTIIPRGKLEKQEKGFMGSLLANPLLPPLRRFQAVGGVLWVPAQAAQDYKPGGVIDGVTFVDERTLLEFLAEDTITLQF